mmetsp:Transcript_43110/g.134044  ORF Transcript_43110/g.134044 Transcript_43110/m.134044 type:complete len:255 (-) Transcript_43110:154-918(-)
MVAMVATPASPRAFFFSEPPACGGKRLEDVLATTQQRAAQWRKDGTRALQLELQLGAEELRRERAGLEDLRSDLQGAEQLTEAARKMRSEGERLAEAMCHSAAAVAQRAETAQAARDRLREAHGARQKELRREEEALAERRRAAEAREAEVAAFLGLFRERLGLDVSRVAPSTVRLAFTLLDEADPAREFLLTLGVDGQQGYRVLDCSPPVPQAGPLLERLNGSAGSPTALPAFVCGMRRAFQGAAGAQGKCRP